MQKIEVNTEKFTLSKQDLFDLFLTKYGDPETTGWSPRRRLKFGYYQPSDIYEATIDKLIKNDTNWLDVGGGRAVFPSNPKLSRILSKRCKKLTAVDPSENVWENPFAHEKVQSMFEEYSTEDKFDLATFRMVAEHVVNPDSVLTKLSEVMSPSGIVVIYTINKFSPIPLITYFTPFSIHFKIKKFFWGGEEKDTFPVAYKMNTRKELKIQFLKHGFSEEYFQYLSDLSAFSRFSSLNYLELSVWKLLEYFNIRYPENNLLGIYRKN